MKRLIPVFVVVAMLFASAAAQGSVSIFELDTFFGPGTVPDGASPWLRATFEDVGANTVKLTLQSLLKNENYVGGLFGWGFNYKGNLDSLTITPVSGNTANYVGKTSDGYTADGDGKFDIMFAWSLSHFGGEDTAIYSLDGDSLTASDFVELSALGTGSEGNYYSAANVRGIGTSHDSTGFIGATSNIVPEPATIAIWSLLALCGGLSLHLWRRSGVHRPGMIGKEREPWTTEAREAIHQIIERGRIR
jgi:hypothetical protein